MINVTLIIVTILRFESRKITSSLKHDSYIKRQVGSFSSMQQVPGEQLLAWRLDVNQERKNDNRDHWRIIRIRMLADLGGGGVATTPFQISNIQESNKTKQKIEDNPLEKEEERKSCMFFQFLCVNAFKNIPTKIFFSKFSPPTPPPL